MNDREIDEDENGLICSFEPYASRLEDDIAWLRGEVERKGQLIELLVTKLCETVDPEEEEPMKPRRTL